MSIVAEHRAGAALLDMLDLAPEWLNSMVPETTAKDLVQRWSNELDLADLLRPCQDELPLDGLPGCRLTKLKAAMPDDAKPALPDRALPTAVAIVALGRARAILLSAAQRDDIAARQRVLPVDDLVYQSRLLIGIFEAHDTDPHPWLIPDPPLR